MPDSLAQALLDRLVPKPSSPQLPDAPRLFRDKPAKGLTDPGIDRTLAAVTRRVPLARYLAPSAFQTEDMAMNATPIGNIIAIDPKLTQQLPEDADLEAILLHEIGHMLQDSGKVPYGENAELSADEFALNDILKTHGKLPEGMMKVTGRYGR